MTYQLTNAKSQRSDQAHFMLSETDHSNMLVFSTLERWLIHHLGLVYNYRYKQCKLDMIVVS